MKIDESSTEITNTLFEIMNACRNLLEVSELHLQISENSGKFPTKFGKFGKIFIVKPKIRKNLLEILVENLGKFVNFLAKYEKFGKFFR